MFEEVFEQEELYDVPLDWGEDGYGEPDLVPRFRPYEEYVQENWDWDEEPPADLEYEDFEPRLPIAIAAWPKFLLLTTLAACLLVAGVLSVAPLDVTSASVAALDSIENAAPSKETIVQSEQALPANASAPAPAPDAAIAAADTYIGAVDCQVSSRFPAKIQQWCGLISEYAAKHSLPPDLVAALILQESGGNPVAYSHSGAVGLMQVMPRDGLAASFMCVSGPCFSSRPSSNELEDPAFNISYGTRMLAGLVRKYGSLREALKSYGPANVGYYYADIVMGLYQRYGK